MKKKMIAMLLVGILAGQTFCPVMAGVASDVPILEQEEQDVNPAGGPDEVMIEDAVESENESETADGAEIQEIPIDEAHFPDAEFRRYLLEKQDKDKDQVFSKEEISNLKKIAFYEDDEADRDYYRFQNMKGIEYFSALEQLILEDNYYLTELDVSQNQSLIHLSVEDTQIKELDLSKNPNLKSLTLGQSVNQIVFAEDNNLDSLYLINFWEKDKKLSDYDLSKLKKLNTLFCDSNVDLNGFDLSQFPMLKDLEAEEQMDTVDVSQNPLLERLNIGVKQMKELDLSANPELTELALEMENVEQLNISNCNKLASLVLYAPKLKSLNLEGKTSLKNLWLHKMEQMPFIYADDCPIETIYVVQTMKLTLKNSTYYDLAKIPGYDKDRIISVKNAELSGSKLYPSKNEVTCKYYVDSQKKHEVTCKFEIENTYIPENVEDITVTGQTTSSISCKWKKVSGADGYRLYAKNINTGKVEKYITLSKVSSNKGTVKGLKPGTGYRMIVKAYNKYNGKTYFSGYESEDTKVTVTKPAKQTLNVKRNDSTKMTLTWKHVDLYGYRFGESSAGYLLYQKTSPSDSYTRIAKVGKKDTDMGTCILEELDKNKTYYFKMRAYIKIFDYEERKYYTVYSAYSNEVVMPPRSSGVKASSIGKSSVTCKWNKAGGVDGYRVYARNIKTDKVEKRVDVKKSATSIKLTGLKSNTKYRLTVRTWKKYNGKKYYSDYPVEDTVIMKTKAASN